MWVCFVRDFYPGDKHKPAMQIHRRGQAGERSALDVGFCIAQNDNDYRRAYGGVARRTSLSIQGDVEVKPNEVTRTPDQTDLTWSDDLVSRGYFCGESTILEEDARLGPYVPAIDDLPPGGSHRWRRVS